MRGDGEGRWGDPLALLPTSAQNRFYARLRADRQARAEAAAAVAGDNDDDQEQEQA